MNDEKPRPVSRITVWLWVLGGLTFTLLLLVLGVQLTQPGLISLSVHTPTTEEVRIDLVIDGRAETRIVTPPVYYSFDADSVRFAVIPVVKSTNDVDVVCGPSPRATGTGPGVTGWVKRSFWSPQRHADVMTQAHVDSMRASISEGDTAPSD